MVLLLNILSLILFTVNANGDIEHGDGTDMTMNPVYRSQPSYDSMEFPRHDLETIRSLGNGVYGRASLARAIGIRDGEKETMVIVKSLSSGDDQVREEFNKEMDVLVGLRHENVVGLLGVCKEVEPVLMIFESLEKVWIVISTFCLGHHDKSTIVRKHHGSVLDNTSTTLGDHCNIGLVEVMLLQFTPVASISVFPFHGFSSALY